MIYYNLADQDFKLSNRSSVGIYNVSLQLGLNLAKTLPLTFLLNKNTNLNFDNSINRKVLKNNNKLTNRFLFDQFGLYKQVEYKKNDWIFLPKGFSSFCKVPPCKLAVYIHDDVYNFWKENYPKYRSKILHKYFFLGLKSSILNADVIFTNSNFTSNEIRLFKRRNNIYKSSYITNIGIGFDHLNYSWEKKDKKGILVYISDWPHKNSIKIIDFLSKWQNQKNFKDPIYFLGSIPNGIYLPKFKNWKSLKLLSEIEYRNLLNNVKYSIFHTQYEGFGMPPGESLIHGVIPIYSSIPALDEVMNGFGYKYKNDDYNSFSACLEEALSNDDAEIDEWKKKFLNKYKWKNVISKINIVLGN